jgi:hypothetical protein
MPGDARIDRAPETTGSSGSTPGRSRARCAVERTYIVEKGKPLITLVE